MTKEKTPNYTAAQEAIISGFAGTGEGGALCLADATTIAAMPEMNGENGARNAKSIVAKINRMGLPYAKKVPTRKDGSKVETKADLVKEIAAAAGATFEGLDKAPRADLIVLRNFAVAVGE